MPTRPRLRIAVAAAAVAALTVPISDAAALPGAARAVPHSTGYLAAPAGTAHFPGRLTATKPTTPRWVFSRTDRRSGWVELRADGSAVATTTSKPAAPDGHGYLWSTTDLSSVAIAAGSWTPTVSLKAKGSLTVTPRVRVYRHNARGYTLMLTSTGRPTKIGSSSVKLTLPAVTLPTVRMAAGDHLYVDVLAYVSKAGTGSGDGILSLDNAGSASDLTFPVRSVVGPATTAAVWHPKPGTTWQWQITGVVDPTLAVDMYDIDLYDAQPAASSYTVPGFGTVNVDKGLNAGIIADLHSRGKVVICYVDSGAWESYRPDASLFPAAAIGGTTGWSGEKWLDIRTASWGEFEPLIAARFDLAKRSGCDGVEPDENNPWGNDPGFAITLADQKAWYLEVARLAHDRGLSVGQKNGIETTDATTIAAFDWNLNEECNMYQECAVLAGYIAADKAVFQVEYADEGATTAFCPADNAAHFSGLLKKLALGTYRVAC